MEPLIDIFTKDQQPLNKRATKLEVHTKGYYHHTAHLWLYTKKGEVLLAQRAASKTIYPLLWDVSVAGHVDAGETIEQAAIREASEELGILVEPGTLNKIGVHESFQRYDNGIIDNEFHNTFLAEFEGNINKLSLEPNEVASVKKVTLDEFLTLLNTPNNKHFVKSNSNYYKFVHSALQKFMYI